MLDVLLLGYGTLALRLLSALLAAPECCRVVGLFHCSATKHANFTLSSADKQLLSLCKRHQIAEIACDGTNSAEFIRTLEQLQPDLVLIGNWGEILKSHVLATPELMFINCHPSLLPAHRGANPYASAIRHGDCDTGVTFHRIDPGVDTGPVWLQERLPIRPDDTGASLRVRCTEQAGKMVSDLLKKVASGSLPTPQSELGKPSYYPRLKWQDGLINWRQPAQQIYDNIRGLNPWVYSYSYLELPLGRMRLTTKSAALRTQSPSPADIPPGTIVEKSKNTIWIATQTPEQQVGLRNIKLEPIDWLSGALLKPGQRLYSDLQYLNIS